MASRRRRPTATTTDTSTEPTLEALSPADEKAFHDWEKSWEDNVIDIAHKVGAEAPELTHEEMLEVAEEREEVAMAAGVADTFEAAMAEAERQEVEEFLAAAAADTFEALQVAEEAKGLDGFFDPTPVHLPAVTVPAKKRVTPNHNHQRVITRQRKS